jgi:hypothetical protein
MYLGRILHESEDDSYAATRQLNRAREKWNRIARILTVQGVESRVKGYFYKAIVQAVLLYGIESWTLPKAKLREFNSFHNRVAHYLCKKHIAQLEDGTWCTPSRKEILEEVGSPLIFDIMVDAVVRNWRAVLLHRGTDEIEFSMPTTGSS